MDDEEAHRLRGSLPEEVTVTAVEHPLVGARLAVRGWTTVAGVRCLVVCLPDGTTATIAVAATCAGASAARPVAADGALLSLEAVRLVLRLLDAAGHDRAGT